MIGRRLLVSAVASAAALIVLWPAAVSADPFDHGNAETFTLAGECDGQPVTLTHVPNRSSTVVFDETGQVSRAVHLEFYAPDGTTLLFTADLGKVPDRLLVTCDPVLLPGGLVLKARVLVPGGGQA